MRKGRNVWEVDGLAAIAEAERETGLPLAVADFEAEVDTVGGLVSALAGRVPQAGDAIPHPRGPMIEVIAADPRRVVRVRLRAARPAPSLSPEPVGEGQ
jgi:CBS domain containing-hemolysin-like protein